MADELQLLEEAIEKIIAKAKEFNLDFYDMYFEICPADILYTFGAYGMPTRFSHWTFGKAYHKMKTQYDYNLSRIYEMVINSDPCYAFLLEGNSLVQNKMVVAHVLGHCDFFKNNARFKHTSRYMVESMANAAERIRGYEFKYGRERVESFLDSVISIQEHINPYQYIKEGNSKKTDKKHKNNCGGGCDSCGSHKHNYEDSPYEDLWSLDNKEGCGCGGKCKKEQQSYKKFPEQPEKDLLFFLMHYAKDLEDWQRDIISVIREEMLYFWPQMETKIMNEGWASYWHSRIMREIDLDEAEAIEFAKMHAGVIMPSKTSLNPYHLGLKIFEDIEKRWNEPSDEEKERFGRQGGEGRQKIFEVREMENDQSFLRNYLTKELVEELDLYVFRRVGYDWKITDKNWETVRDTLVNNLTNCGFPIIVVEDADFSKRGELYLKHCYEDLELDVFYLEKTLPYVYKLWGRQVHLETIIDNKPVLFTFNGEKSIKKFL
ncbi:SpoVR family protein [Desulfolucanica intricata]|uniref:SpoVR family protein n=1 Tax=Desulfolucanica intricata TaxID=1285191 RepID=UPI000834A4BD|nr:SpoVR family protein [Desulfolucanica intricata]